MTVWAICMAFLHFMPTRFVRQEGPAVALFVVEFLIGIAAVPFHTPIQGEFA